MCNIKYEHDGDAYSSEMCIIKYEHGGDANSPEMDTMKHKHGGDIYSQEVKMDYSANINPLGMPKEVVQAAYEGILNSANYPDIHCGKLRDALSFKEGIEKEHIICGNGAAELIFSLAAAIKPKKALLAAPGFAEYEQALRINGCEVVYYLLKEEQGFELQEDYLKAITPDLDLIFLCVPNNPTGLVSPKEFLDKILDKCRACNVWMVVDECFNDFLDDAAIYTMKKEIALNDHLFILKAFTKLYAMAGLRLGYGLCSNPELLEKMADTVQPWNVSIPAQMAGTAALREEGFVENSKALIREERQYLSTKMKELGFRVYDSKANFLFFYGPGYLAQECKKQGILIRDCSNYYGLKEGYYRIAVRTHKENEALIEIMQEIINAQDSTASRK